MSQSNLEFSPRTKFQIDVNFYFFLCDGKNYFIELLFFSELNVGVNNLVINSLS